MKFLNSDYKDVVQSANGLDYIPWAAAVARAKSRLFVETWGSAPYLDMLNGAVVCVKAGDSQRIYLPVLDAKNRPVKNPSARDISDSINRCRAKAVAMTTGFGLPLYAGYKEPEKFIAALGKIERGADLTKVAPLVEKKPGKAEYVPWPAALAAAMLADPGFEWAVKFFETADENGEVRSLPFCRVSDGTYMVAVEVFSSNPHGVSPHTEWLPIMGVREVQTAKGIRKMDHQPLNNPGVDDWNRCVMRCLTKAIAVSTGYGITVYGDESIPAPATETATNEQATPSNHRHADLVIAIRDKLKELGKQEEGLIKWLGSPKAKNIDELDQEALNRAAKALKIAA